MERYKERMGYARLNIKPKIEDLLRILSYATEDDTLSDYHRTLRIINNGFKQTTYLRFRQWRFILEKSTDKQYDYILKTVERIKPSQC